MNRFRVTRRWREPSQVVIFVLVGVLLAGCLGLGEPIVSEQEAVAPPSQMLGLWKIKEGDQSADFWRVTSSGKTLTATIASVPRGPGAPSATASGQYVGYALPIGNHRIAVQVGGVGQLVLLEAVPGSNRLYLLDVDKASRSRVSQLARASNVEVNFDWGTFVGPVRGGTGKDVVAFLRALNAAGLIGRVDDGVAAITDAALDRAIEASGEKFRQMREGKVERAAVEVRQPATRKAACAQFQSSAREGSIAGQAELGKCELNGWAGEVSVVGGLRALHFAAEYGSAEALFQLGVIHAEGRHGKQKWESGGKSYLELAARQGHSGATALLARMKDGSWEKEQLSRESASAKAMQQLLVPPWDYEVTQQGGVVVLRQALITRIGSGAIWVEADSRGRVQVVFHNPVVLECPEPCVLTVGFGANEEVRYSAEPRRKGDTTFLLIRNSADFYRRLQQTGILSIEVANVQSLFTFEKLDPERLTPTRR